MTNEKIRRENEYIENSLLKDEKMQELLLKIMKLEGSLTAKNLEKAENIKKSEEKFNDKYEELKKEAIFILFSLKIS